jgi:hypothetical protein
MVVFRVVYRLLMPKPVGRTKLSLSMTDIYRRILLQSTCNMICRWSCVWCVENLYHVTLVHQPRYWWPTNPRIRPSTRQCHDGYNTWRLRQLFWAEVRWCLCIGRTPDGGGGRVNLIIIRSINRVGGQEYGVVCGCPHINVPRGTIGRALLGWFSWIGRCRSVEAASPIAMVAVVLLVAYVWEMALRDSFWAKWDS